MFIGRLPELKALSELRAKSTASLVCVMGRRRIGKSALIEEFGKSYKSFTEIQGLAPVAASSNQDQLDHFAERLSLRFKTRKEFFNTWTEAFTSLAKLTRKGEQLILLDEISWMGRKDPLFSSRLKDVWDLEFKKNSKLILVLCGSVSSWIEANISRNSNFEGRISLDIQLKDLLLPEIKHFWGKQNLEMSSREKILLLSVTGGVPKYLEEVLPTESVSQNIIRLCFKPSGFLFNEFDRIFYDIFERRGKSLEKIIKACLERRLTPAELALHLKTKPNSDLSEQLHILELSGFLTRDFYYHADGERSKLGHLRVNDNYLRFYLKYIQPLKDKIQTGAKTLLSISELKNFDSILGLQFENLILANRKKLHELLNIPDSEIRSSSPHVQRKRVKTKGACQIDLLIHTFLDVFYLCEFKCQKQMDKGIIEEVQRKMDVLSVPRRSALKPVLVYEGEISPKNEVEFQEFFYKMIPFREFL